MAQISFPIVRSDADSMKVDTYRHRVIYLTVNEADKDGLFRRLLPSYATRHYLLTVQIRSKVAEGLRDQLNRQKMRLASRTSTHPLKKDTESLASTNKTRISSFCNQIKGYRVNTLELLRDAGKDVLATIASTGGLKSESLTRELIIYANALKGAGDSAENALNDVRQAHPKFALVDLSELTGEDRSEAERIIRASELLRRRRLAEVYEHKAALVGLIENFANKTQFVTPALAEVIMDIPESVESLTEYMDSCSQLSIEIDPGHFREYLSNASRPLSAGVL